MFLWVLRDNPYRRFYDRLGGEMLNEHKQEDYGEGNVTSVAYGWRDLEALSASLEGVTRTDALTGDGPDTGQSLSHPTRCRASPIRRAD